MNKLIVTGVEFNRHYMAAVTLMRHKQTFSLIDFRIFPLAKAIFPENELCDYQQFVKKLTELRKGLSLFSRRVSAAVPELAVISRQVEIKPQASQAMENWAVRKAFSEVMTLPLDTLCLDYVALSEARKEFWVCAAKKEVVHAYLQALRCANLKPVLVDTEKQSFLQLLSEAMRVGQRKTQMLIEIRENMVRVGLMSRAGCFYRNIPYKTHVDEHYLIPEQELSEIHQLIATGFGPPEGIWTMGCSPEHSFALQQEFQCPAEFFHPFQMMHGYQQTGADDSQKCALAVGIAMRGIIARECGYAA